MTANEISGDSTTGLLVRPFARGQGVLVIPYTATLTTQEAADLLGIPRRSLVRLLDSGRIPYERPGRHRLVLVADLIRYEDDARSERRRGLDEMVRRGEADGVYDQ